MEPNIKFLPMTLCKIINPIATPANVKHIKLKILKTFFFIIKYLYETGS